MGLKAALKDLSSKIDDLSSLHVQTYTGTVNFEVGAAGGDGDSKQDAFEKALGEALSDPSGKVTLVQETLIRFDGDTYNFIGDGVSADLSQVHKDAVEAGIKTRQALMEVVTGWFD